jgi:predicted DCC family thiol-disulfide oxidoreductase YuxK
MKKITVLYDASCRVCVRCRAWMEHRRSYVEIEFLPCCSAAARARYGKVPWLGEELVVVGDGGEVWAGPAAFLVCLWALEDFREWSYRLSGPELAPLAEKFFAVVSSQRRWVTSLLEHSNCKDGRCKLGHRPEAIYR